MHHPNEHREKGISGALSNNINFRFEILETFCAKWKSFFRPKEEPVPVLICSLTGKLKTLPKKMDVALPLHSDIADSFSSLVEEIQTMHMLSSGNDFDFVSIYSSYLLLFCKKKNKWSAKTI